MINYTVTSIIGTVCLSQIKGKFELGWFHSDCHIHYNYECEYFNPHIHRIKYLNLSDIQILSHCADLVSIMLFVGMLVHFVCLSSKHKNCVRVCTSVKRSLCVVISVVS